MGERWHLRPELESSHLVDTWSVRSAPSFDARVVGTVRSGEPFTVFSRQDDWLELRTTAQPCESRWAHCKFAGVDALSPVQGGRSRQSTPRIHNQGSQVAQRQVPQRSPRTAATSVQTAVAPAFSPPAVGMPRAAGTSVQSSPREPQSRPLSNQENVRELLAEFREQRRTLDALNGGSRGSTEGATRRARAAAAAVQRTVAKLELLGVDSEKLLELEEHRSETVEKSSDEEPEEQSELTRSESFPHSEFSNPRSESCWLSTFFQSLWHSRVFHAAFERLVRPLPSSRSGSTLCALRETWKHYETAANNGHPVPVNELVDAWGRGYGDCADAFGKLQEDEELRPLADLFVLVPVPFTGHAPSPRDLWERVLEMGSGNDAPIVALDFSLPPLSRTSIRTLVQRLAPASSTSCAAGEDMSDLGERHRLVAMICYMEEFRHYIIFCRSLSDRNRWLLFNDLPGTARGVQKEYSDWQSVADSCSLVDAIPKMCLYESSAAATRALERAAAGGNNKGCRQM